MKLIKRIPIFLMILGIIAYLIGLIKHPGIPYQDPTKEMLLEYNNNARQAEEILNYGLLIIVPLL